MRRHRLSRQASRKMFRRGARHVHSRNMSPAPMRGGYRI